METKGDINNLAREQAIVQDERNVHIFGHLKFVGIHKCEVVDGEFQTTPLVSLVGGLWRRRPPPVPCVPELAWD